MIKGLLCKDPSKRLGCGNKGAEAIKAHPFFEGVNWEAVYRKMVKPDFVPSSASIDNFEFFQYSGNSTIPLTDFDVIGECASFFGEMEMKEAYFLPNFSYSNPAN